jgi:hypothetical protein
MKALDAMLKRLAKLEEAAGGGPHLLWMQPGRTAEDQAAAYRLAHGLPDAAEIIVLTYGDGTF